MTGNKENYFLTLCSHIDIDESIKEELKKLVFSGLDWAGLTNKARLQGVAQFLYFHLSKQEEAWSIIPPESKDSLKQYYYRILARNWPLQVELQKVILLFNTNRIPVIVLKGAALLETVYKDIGLRPIVSDVDLLVKEEDLPKLKSVLSEAGYQKPDKLDEKSMEKFGGETHLCKKGGLFLDIHIALSPHERFRDILKINRDEDVWSKAKKYKNSAGELDILSPTHLILHLCLHLATAHAFRGLFRFCDIREAILTYKTEIDWKELIIKAKYCKLKTIAYYTLFLTEELFGPVVDKKILAALKPNKLHLFFINLFIDKNKILSLPDTESSYDKYVIQLLLMDSLVDMLKVVGKSFFPSREWLAHKYNVTNKFKLFIYRLGHPFIFIFRMAAG